MRKRALAAITLLCAVLAGCSSNDAEIETTENNVEGAFTVPEDESLPPVHVLDDKYRTTYEIFVYSFYDSDGDGIGDLNGVRQKLDYINDGDDKTSTDLGCNAIWLMPICPSPTYHKYDVTDYKDIDPEYGTMSDFEEMVKECHRRGIKVYTDLVLNHTSTEHPWFKEAKEYLKNHTDIDSKTEEECPYVYYYNFTKEQQTGYERLNGTEWYYEARFWSGMPDLNLDNEKVRAEISDITQFWTDKGVDGFRLDAVTSYYTNDNEKNIEFMTWLNDTVKAQNEDAYIVGEAWTNSSIYGSYYASGIDSFFDFDFSGSEGTIAAVARGKKQPLLFAKEMQEEEKAYASYNDFYVNAPFYTNHDMARSAGYFTGRGTEQKVKMAGALNLLMGGNAFIYYGEELGMKGSGKDENKRAPMQWGNGVVNSDSADAVESEKIKIILDASGMTNGPKDMEKFDMIYHGLDQQLFDKTSIYNYYKKAIRLRNTYPVIARGNTQPVEVLSEDKLGAFVKYKNSGLSSNSEDYIILDEEGNNIGMNGSVKSALGITDPYYGEAAVLVVINNGDEAKVIDLSKWSGTGDDPELSFDLETGDEAASLEGTNLTIPSYGIVVIK